MSGTSTLGRLARRFASWLPLALRRRLLGDEALPPWRRRNLLRLAVAVIFYGIFLYGTVTWLDVERPEAETTVWLLVPGVVFLAFLFQTLDSTAGMGFGTALTPLLFAAGYGPLDVVPSLLVSQAFTGLLSGWMHQELENVQFSLETPLGETTRALLVVTGIGVPGVVLSIYLVYVAVKLPDRVIETYVAFLVIVMGLLVAGRGESRLPGRYRERRLFAFAMLAGANKGLGGGGYGPVVTLGGIYAGLGAKSAAALTIFAEGLVSTVGAVTFLLVMGEIGVDFSLLPSLLTGSFVAALVAPFIVHFLSDRVYRRLVAAYAMLIGCFVLLRLYVI